MRKPTNLGRPTKQWWGSPPHPAPTKRVANPPPHNPGQGKKLAVQIVGPGSQLDEVYRELTRYTRAKQDGVAEGLPMGEGSSKFSALCWDAAREAASLAASELRYLDDTLSSTRLTRSLVLYGLSTLREVAVCV